VVRGGIGITSTVIAGALLWGACASPYSSDNKRTPPKPPVERVDELFVPSETEDGNTQTVFHTNDERYWSAEGKTIWTVWGDTAPFTSRTVTMGKVHGYSGGGYGLVLCQGEREVNGTPLPTMLVVMINNEGQYIVGKAIGGTFEDFDWWKETPHLRRGAGVTNEVSVNYDAGTGEYSLEINGYFIERFRDDEEPVHQEGKSGYIVVITPFDRFPGEDVDVYYMEAR
jgi:hypothetical protein